MRQNCQISQKKGKKREFKHQQKKIYRPVVPFITVKRVGKNMQAKFLHIFPQAPERVIARSAQGQVYIKFVQIFYKATENQF